MHNMKICELEHNYEIIETKHNGAMRTTLQRGKVVIATLHNDHIRVVGTNHSDKQLIKLAKHNDLFLARGEYISLEYLRYQLGI